MFNKTINIEQTLHGYSNGHHLLASSIELSENSKRKMAILSDLSGPEIQNGFREYYTGYFIPDDNMAVLSYTWYANEMERPGCVWTQSLLFEPNDLTFVGNNYSQLANFFCRPDYTKEFKQYAQSISLQVNELFNNKLYVELDNVKLRYLIWVIWGNESPSLIFADSSNDYSNEILYLWTRHNKDLDYGFSFSTGSLAIRKFDGETFSLQVIPKTLISNISRIQNEYKILYENEEIKLFPIWVNRASELLMKDEWNDFNKFRGRFGSKYFASKYFSAFIKIYIGAKAEIFNLNIAEGLNIIEKLFSIEEKEDIGMQLIDLFLSDNLFDWIYEDSSLKILLYLAENNWISVDNLKIKKLINKGLIVDKANSKKFVKYLSKKEYNNIGEIILTIYAEVISIEMFPDFTDMELSVCSLLITLRSDFARCTLIWKQTKAFQDEILQCLKKQINDDKFVSILPIVLDNSLYDFTFELYDLIGEKSINIFLDYLLGNRALLSQSSNSIKFVCKKHQDICFNRLKTTYTQMKNQQIVLMLEIIDPYINTLLYFDIRLLNNIFEAIYFNNLSNENKMIISLFYFPIIMKSNYEFPINMVSCISETLHTSLARQTFPNNEWDKIEKLLPEIVWYNRWDRCKRLRKAIKNKGYSLRLIEDEENSDFIF